MKDAYLSFLQKNFPWDRWEKLILSECIMLDRPRNSPHPRYPDILYPMDYGFICNTKSTDGEDVDVFVGTGPSRLVGMIIAYDRRKKGREVKLLWRCVPAEIYLAYGFINFAPSKLKGQIVLRFPMKKIWEMQTESC